MSDFLMLPTDIAVSVSTTKCSEEIKILLSLQDLEQFTLSEDVLYRCHIAQLLVNCLSSIGMLPPSWLSSFAAIRCSSHL